MAFVKSTVSTDDISYTTLGAKKQQQQQPKKNLK
jgi:hypothetical protein